MHEPTTVLTDYLLGTAAVVFAIALWRRNQRAWALAFAATAAGAALGGTYHGWAHLPLWKPTVYAIGLASLFLLAGLGRWFAIFALAKFVAYAIWMATHDDFRYVIYDYGLTLLIVAAWALVHLRHPASRWILGSAGVSVVAAVVQQSGFNDLYHLIQIVALWLLYRGGVRLKTQPT